MAGLRSVHLLGLCAIALAAILAVPVIAVEPVVKPIQPGAGLGAGTPGDCTIGFLFHDGFDWYGSTAAHCVDPDELVTNNEACCAAFGRVVVDDDNELPGGLDVALFVIFPAKHGLINPAVRHWGGPSGFVTAADIAPRDLVLWYGTPLGAGYCYPSCEPTTMPIMNAAQGGIGTFTTFQGTNARYEAHTLPGDSGAPVLSNKDGKALAIHAFANPHFNLPNAVGTAGGARVQSVLDRMQTTYGLTLTLQTAPFTPAV